MPLTITHQDITKVKVDAIVNAANTDLQMGGGVCGAIFEMDGVSQLQAACDKLAPIETGEAVITSGFNLPAKFIIHVAEPIYREWSWEESEELLRAAYTNALELAVENNLNSIAFPLISSGIYGYPKDEALRLATTAIKDFLSDHELDVRLVIFDKTAFSVGQELLGSVESYIDEHYVELHEYRHSRLYDAHRGSLHSADAAKEPLDERLYEPLYEPPYDEVLSAPTSLDDLIGNLDEPFSQMLLRLIDAKGMSDVEVYKRANLDRRLFSKIRSNVGYRPSKRTVIALAIAMQLSLDETDELLERAGYAISHAIKFDVIIEFFITHGKYDIFEINEVLFTYDQPLLGG